MSSQVVLYLKDELVSSLERKKRKNLRLYYQDRLRVAQESDVIKVLSLMRRSLHVPRDGSHGGWVGKKNKLWVEEERGDDDGWRSLRERDKRVYQLIPAIAKSHHTQPSSSYEHRNNNNDCFCFICNVIYIIYSLLVLYYIN